MIKYSYEKIALCSDIPFPATFLLEKALFGLD